MLRGIYEPMIKLHARAAQLDVTQVNSQVADQTLPPLDDPSRQQPRTQRRDPGLECVADGDMRWRTGMIEQTQD